MLIMRSSNFLWFGTGFFIAAIVFGIVNISLAGLKLPYPYTEYEPGQWISETEQFFTYETICSGYYIKDVSNKNKVKYIGYGDLDYKYTYEEAVLSTTTVPTI